MPNYQIGNTYELEYVKNIDLQSGTYLCVTDGDHDYTVRPYDFQLDWPGQIPVYIPCYVKGLTLSGHPQFVQDKYELLKSLYTNQDTDYHFLVDSIVEKDGIKKGYALIDTYGISHYYPKYDASNEWTLGQDVVLHVKDIERKDYNKSILRLYAPKPATAATTAATAERVATGRDYLKDVYEGDSVEFKTSIVFPAGGTEADIDEQTRIIMQTIAGFMNKNGGTLYIGVNDSGAIVGFEDDFEYLQKCKDSKKKDIYELAIRNKINTWLGPVPNTKVKITFEEGPKTGISYCKVEIEKSLTPVYVKGYEIYVRAGNMTVHLRNEHITAFIMEKMGMGLQSLPLPTIPKYVDPDDAQEETESVVTRPEPEVKKAPVIPISGASVISPATRREAYLYFLPGGYCRYSKEELTDFVYRLPIPSSPKKYDLVIVYSHGDSDWVCIESALFGTGRNSGHAKWDQDIPGWNADLEIRDVFCVRNDTKLKKDLIAYVSERNGERYIKFHEVSAIAHKAHAHLGNKGNNMLPKGSELLYAVRQEGSAEVRRALTQSDLIYPDTYSGNGTLIGSLSAQQKNMLKFIIERLDDAALPSAPAPVEIEVAPAGTEAPAPAVAIPSATYVYIMGRNGEVVKALKGGDDSGLSNVPFKYDEIYKSCQRKYGDMEGVSFIKFICPSTTAAEAAFDTNDAKELMSIIFKGNAKFIETNDPADHVDTSISEVAVQIGKSIDEVKSMIENAYLLTENATLPVYDPENKSEEYTLVA